jgi:hypothetical protein
VGDIIILSGIFSSCSSLKSKVHHARGFIVATYLLHHRNLCGVLIKTCCKMLKVVINDDASISAFRGI